MQDKELRAELAALRRENKELKQRLAQQAEVPRERTRLIDSVEAVPEKGRQSPARRKIENDVADPAHAELRARHAETLLGNAIEGLSELFVLWDADDRLVLCNGVFREINEPIIEFTEPGTPLEAHLRAGIAKGLYPPSEGREEEWLIDRIRRHHNPGKPMEVQRQNGRWLLIQGQKMPDGSIVTIGSDITERKRAEAALQAAHDELERRVERRTAELNQANDDLRQEIAEREEAQRELRASQALLSAMVENSPDLTGLRDPYGRYLHVNKKFEEWYGLPREDIIGKSVEELWPPEIAAEFVQRDEEAISKRETLVRTLDLTFPDGTMRTIRSARFPIFVDDTTVLAIGFINSDVTHLVRAQRDAIEKSTLLQTVLDAMPAYIALRDTENRHQFANRQLVEYIGLPAQDFVGNKMHELLADGSDSILDTMARRVLATGLPISGEEFKPVRSPGSVFLANIVPTRGTDGRISGTVSIAFDITEHKKLEEQLRQSQKMDAVGQLTGGVAHDFNNLLGVIIGNLEFLEEGVREIDTSFGRECREMVHAAIQAAEHGAMLNRQLLAFSRQQPLMPKAIDPKEQIAGIVDLLRRTLGETIAVDVVADPSLWSCEADPVQVEAALLNLALNARDAMPQGGRLIIELSNRRLDARELGDQTEVRPGSYVMMAVRDTGRGIPPDVLPHVFEPFYTTKEVGQGSGLGLSMVFGFARQSNGHVAIESEEGVGTTVRLYLPRASYDPDAALDEAPTIPPAEGETVLLVEDDPAMQALTERLLEDLGYTVTAAGDGAAALAAMTGADRIDVLLTDVVLPGGMDGSLVAAAAAERFSDISILYMSGYPRDAIVNHGRLDDGVLLLEKPFRKHELARKLREAIDA